MRRASLMGPCFAVAVALAGCGDSEPVLDVDPSKQVGDMSEVDMVRFCEWGLELNGGEGRVHYCDGFTVTIETVEECMETALWWDIVQLPCECDLTVGEIAECERDRAADPCTFDGRDLASCEAAFACLDECRGIGG